MGHYFTNDLRLRNLPSPIAFKRDRLSQSAFFSEEMGCLVALVVLVILCLFTPFFVAATFIRDAVEWIMKFAHWFAIGGGVFLGAVLLLMLFDELMRQRQKRARRHRFNSSQRGQGSGANFKIDDITLRGSSDDGAGDTARKPSPHEVYLAKRRKKNLGT